MFLFACGQASILAGTFDINDQSIDTCPVVGESPAV
jgi:hypothetical protein